MTHKVVPDALLDALPPGTGDSAHAFHLTEVCDKRIGFDAFTRLHEAAQYYRRT